MTRTMIILIFFYISYKNIYLPLVFMTISCILKSRDLYGVS